MKYWNGFKYVVAETFTVRTAIKGYNIIEPLSSLRPDGRLTVIMGYAWDGNSGPCIDTRSSLEASCVHDVLCDYVNQGLLPAALQPLVDQEYYTICVRKKMWWRRARWRMLAIRWYMTGKGSKRYTRKLLEA